MNAPRSARLLAQKRPYPITPSRSSFLQPNRKTSFFLKNGQKKNNILPTKPDCLNQDSLLADVGCGHHYGCRSFTPASHTASHFLSSPRKPSAAIRSKIFPRSPLLPILEREELYPNRWDTWKYIKECQNERKLH